MKGFKVQTNLKAGDYCSVSFDGDELSACNFGVETRTGGGHFSACDDRYYGVNDDQWVACLNGYDSVPNSCVPS